MFTKNGNILKINGNWINPHIEPEPYPFDSVTIGTQTWMLKNLSIDDGQGGVYIAEHVEANGLNMGEQYYYTPSAAIRIANSIPGWHLPSKEEWQTLASYVGTNSASKLKSTSGWDNNNGTDDYGFNGEPTGCIANNEVSYPGKVFTCWSSTYEIVDANVEGYYTFSLLYNSNDIDVIVYDNIRIPSPVRLIKDT